MKLPTTIYRQLNGLSTPAAFDLLIGLGEKQATVIRGGRVVLVMDWVEEDDVSWTMANHTEILRFWGGPPTRQNYYYGTLYTLLLDKIYNYLRHHTLSDLVSVMHPPKKKTLTC
jgi:hypothetical protein